MLVVRAEIDLEFAALEIEDLVVSPPDPAFDLTVDPDCVASPAAARELYRRFGVDPTRHRPSSEALLRRVRRGEGLPRINSLVDAANLLSVRHQVPVGLYDLDGVRGGELVIRTGRDGEGYTGIGKDRVNVSGRICVADAEGACGNPSSDSARTMITEATTHAAWIYFLPVTPAVLSETVELVGRHGRGRARVL